MEGKNVLPHVKQAVAAYGKEHHFSRCLSYIECFFYFFLLKISLTIECNSDYNRIYIQWSK